MDHWGREATNETFDQTFDEIFDTPRAVEAGIWGVVTGAAAICVLGFSIFGWTLRDTAERMTSERAQTEVIDALAPICVERFRQQPDGPAKPKEFAQGHQRSIIEKGGWATMPGAAAPNSAVAAACAERLGRSYNQEAEVTITHLHQGGEIHARARSVEADTPPPTSPLGCACSVNKARSTTARATPPMT